MEKSAKLILKERRYESNTKRHQKLVEEENMFNIDKFNSIKDMRSSRRQHTIDHDANLDKLGYIRYKNDTKQVEEYIEKVQSKELGRARESYAKLQLSMEITEKKQKDAEESFNLSAEQAKQAVQSLEKSIKAKQEKHNRTIDKVREKCLF